MSILDVSSVTLVEALIGCGRRGSTREEVSGYCEFGFLDLAINVCWRRCVEAASQLREATCGAVHFIVATLLLCLTLSWQCASATVRLPDESQTPRQQMRDIESVGQSQQQESRQESLLQSSKIDANTEESIVHDTACLRWKSVEVHGLDLLTVQQKREVLDALPANCITVQKLTILSRLITEVFLQQGYFRISLDQGTKGELLVWNVRVGNVSSIKNGTSLRTSNLFPNLIGKPVNIRDLDQGLEQANRLAGHRMTMDIYPEGSGDDVSIVLRDESTGSIHGVVAWNNMGSSSTGRTQISGQVTVSNPTGIADSLSINATSTFHVDPSRYSRSAGVFYSVPYGRWTFSMTGGLSVYRTLAELSINKVRLDGNSWFVGLRSEYTFSRNAMHISSAYGQLTREVVNSLFMGYRVAIQSPSLTTLAFGINHTLFIDGNLIGANVEYKQGLSIIGADENIRDAGFPVAQFKKISTTISRSRTYAIGKREIRLDQTLAGQYSPDVLAQIEKMGISDRGGVRGIRDFYLSGDYGYYLRQTISSRFYVGNGIISPYFGLDVGRARQHEGRWQDAVSGTMGVGFDRGPWSIDLSLSRARVLAEINGDAWSMECAMLMSLRF